MNKKYKGTVVYPPSIPWSILKQRPQQMCEQFAKNGYRVIFCDYAQTKSQTVEVEPNLFINYDFNGLVQDIQKGKLTVDIYYFSWGETEKYIDLVKPKKVIFDSLDIFEQNKQMDKISVERADLVLASSQYIYDIRKKEHNNVILVRNACDSRLIQQDYSTPEDMLGLNKPVGTVGAMGEWVLTSLMRNVAKEHMSVFIGKELPKKCPSNVFNLGHKEHKQLINYYNSLSVGLIPFNTKLEVIQACNPIKMYEYLACGLPIVSTSWSETEQFNDLILTSPVEDYKLFIENIELAKELSQNDKYKAQAVSTAKENTWEVRFETIFRSIRGWVK